MKHNLKAKSLAFWRRWVKPLLVVVVVSTTLRSAIADWNDVPTGSMKPSILEGDRIFVNKLAYDLKVPFTTWRITRWADPKRGDIVVFFSPDDGRRLVKRVIALPGDTIEMRNNRLILNGEEADYQLQNGAPATEGIESTGLRTKALEITAEQSHPVAFLPGRGAKRSFAPIIIPQGEYFMMGDNRDASHDSRYFGCVERSLIVGRANWIVLSLDLNNYCHPRWNRFFTELP